MRWIKKKCIHLESLSFLIYHCMFIKQGIVVDVCSVQKSEYQWNIACRTVEWSLNCYYYHFNYLCSKLYNLTITLKGKYRLAPQGAGSSSRSCSQLTRSQNSKSYWEIFHLLLNCTSSFTESLDCTPHLMKHLFEQTKYICTNKYKCQDLTHKCKHMSFFIPAIWLYDRLKSLLNGNDSLCLWKEWPDKSSHQFNVFRKYTFLYKCDGLMTHRGRTGNKRMDAWSHDGQASNYREKPCQPCHLTLLLDWGRIKHKFLNLPAQGCQETNHHPTTLWGPLREPWTPSLSKWKHKEDNFSSEESS